MNNIRMTLSVHWEGRNLDGVGPLAEARRRLLPGIPMVHFVSAAYFARGGDIETIVDAMLPAFESNDEIALHVPAWRSVGGSSPPPSTTVIAGEDPELEVEYPGIGAQVDCGYTHPISGYPRHAIEAFIVSSKLLLRPLLQRAIVERKLQVERMLRGIRAGHGMGSDVFLAAACNTGFAYDASSMDAVWARSMADDNLGESERGGDLFAPLWSSWARLWGPQECRDQHLSNHGMRAGTGGAGVSATTAPFFIARRGETRLLEMPVNLGVAPPANPQHVTQLLTNVLESPPGLPRILGLAIRQETAEGSLDALLSTQVLRSSRIQWTTNVDLLPQLIGAAEVPEPERVSPLQKIRQQIANGQLPTMPTVETPPASSSPVPAAPPIQVPPIQVPPIRT